MRQRAQKVQHSKQNEKYINLYKCRSIYEIRAIQLHYEHDKFGMERMLVRACASRLSDVAELNGDLK